VTKQKTRGERRLKEGIVVSDKMEKTVVVAVQRLLRHPLYRRVIRHTRKFKAHDAESECNIGDRVRIAETRPYSKHKNWRVVEIIQRAE